MQIKYLRYLFAYIGYFFLILGAITFIPLALENHPIGIFGCIGLAILFVIVSILGME